MKVKILGLNSCGHCKKLRADLEKIKVDHEFTDCNKDTQNCDNLEGLTGSSIYPMVLIQDLEDNLLEVYFLTKNYNEMIAGSHTKNGIRLIPTHSTDSLLKYVSNRLNLKT